MKNTDIRQRAKDKHVHLWEVADALGIADCNFSRKLRKELTDSEKEDIIALIDRIAAEKSPNVAAN